MLGTLLLAPSGGSGKEFLQARNPASPDAAAQARDSVCLATAPPAGNFMT